MLQRILVVAIVVIAIGGSTESATAQYGIEGISSHGSASVQAKTARLKMQVEICACGKTLESSLKRLKVQSDAATANVKSLGADKGSIVLSVPQMITRRPNVAVTSRFEGGPQPTYAVPAAATGALVPVPSATPLPLGYGQTPAVAPPPSSPPVRLYVTSLTLKAEWPLEGKTAEQLMVGGESLQDKILAADVGGIKSALKDLSPEEQQALAQALAVVATRSVLPAPYSPSSPYALEGYGSPAPYPGSCAPTFQYVGVISKDQRKTAFATAYARAKRNAEELAEGAGVRLGGLASLSGGVPNFSPPVLGGRLFGDDVGSSSEPLVLAASPAGLIYNISVSASYHILPAQSKP